ncbi:MAG TPA: peptidoglycan editing factor PgeF [Candidatus Obscuribacterales bacterium]
MSGTWHWHTETEHPYLTTTLLQPWPHGFFTRASWPQPPEVLSRQLDAEAVPYRAKQVHGKAVLSPQDFPAATAADTLPEADAVITVAPQQAAWVCSADCTPVLVADVATGQVAAAHAGWRGTALRIVPATIQHLQEQGSRLEDLRVALGPAIAGTVYQVSTQVAVTVGRSLPLTATTDEAVVAQLQTLESPPLLPDATPGRLRLDVRRINVLQLLALGLTPAQVAIAPHCTYQEPERFFSYRRTQEKKVQWSGIVSGAVRGRT